MAPGNGCIRVVEYPFDWDLLLIFDASRYDIFKIIYNNFFSGTLLRGFSCGSATAEWFYNNFVNNKFNDIIYLSSNPYIGNVTTRVWLRNLRFVEFNAGKHFYKVIDIWLQRWREDIDTVHPYDVTVEAIKVLSRYAGSKRLIVHYMQPHAPFILCHRLFKIKTRYNYRVMNLNDKRRKLWNILRYLYLFYNVPGYVALDLFLGDKPLYRLANWLLLPPLSLLNEYERVFGRDLVRACYAQNLRLALRYSTLLVSEALKLGLRVVITSDHGEFLGEYGSWGHWGGSKRPLLRYIPILRVNDVKFIYKDIKIKLLSNIFLRKANQTLAS